MRHQTLIIVICLILLAGCALAPPKQMAAPIDEHAPELPGTFLVMIDNHEKANPQSGLATADIVYEVIAEGGITRYLAVFHSYKPELVGPVRSARTYFVEIAKAYNAPFVHAGGHETALRLIHQLQLHDIDAINNSGAFFWRAKQRSAPHNLYTDFDQLLQCALERQMPLTPLAPLSMGELPADNRGQPANFLEIIYHKSKSYNYAVSYCWEDTSYKRYINQEIHQDASGQAITAANIIVLAAPSRSVVDRVLISEVKLLGKGPALFFYNGHVLRGEWCKENAETGFQFLFAGQPITLPERPTWIQIVPNLKQVTYGYKEN